MSVPYTFEWVGGGSSGLTFLQLVQRAMRECGASGASLSTVSGASGEAERFCDWVNQAWLEIQTRRDDWDWMKASVLLGSGASFTTVAGTASYPLGTGDGTCGVTADLFQKWDVYSFRNYTTTTGYTNEIFLDPIRYGQWRNAYMYGAMRNVQTRPVAVAIGPDKSVCLGPPPNALYTITADYWTKPTWLQADGDTPGMPSQFHMAIVYLAMTYYGGYEAAPEVLSRGQAGYDKLMRQLGALQAPNVVPADPLA